MYKSRMRFGNNNIKIGIDSLTGEILELVNEKNGDNLIKSTPFNLPRLFSLSIGDKKLTVPNKSMIDDNPELKPKISCLPTNSNELITLVYEALTDGIDVYDIRVEVLITIPKEKGQLTFSANVENNSGLIINRFAFPIINGIFIGENYKSNELVFPFFSGMKFVNPIEYFAKERQQILWKWQEYKYFYPYDGCSGSKDADGFYSYKSLYPGPASMAWMDLYDNFGGLYIGMHEYNGVCSVSAQTLGPAFPGMTFSFEKLIEHSEGFEMSGIMIAVHNGDWHDGADLYKSAVHIKNPKKPSKLDGTISLVAHYDFKYQNGGIVHRFSDIPKLVNQAEELNTKHILISGWHKDGFDHGFPEYYIDPDLGTEEEFIKGLKYASEKSVKVSFYINTRIANAKYQHLTEFIEQNAVENIHGIKESEKYGDSALTFYTMCAASYSWQKKLLDAIEYVANRGATGVYLDQLVMAAPRLCHNKNHNHEIDGWPQGYRDLLTQANNIRNIQGANISVIAEGCSDYYGEYIDGGLVSTFYHLAIGSFPEMYRYTFPNDLLIDMVYPKRNLAMRPVHVAQKSTFMINKAFTTDMYFWIYDLEEDNSFFNDPTQKDYLNSVLALKNKWKEKYKDFVFADEKGIVQKNKEFMVKSYYKDDKCLIVYAGEDVGTLNVKMDFQFEIIDYLNDSEAAIVTEIEGNSFRVKGSRFGLIYLKTRF